MILKRLAFLASLLTLACLPMLPALAQQPPPYVNVVDFGATPDVNNDDDSAAINQAIISACASGTKPRAVFFPAGQYVITSSINCSYASGTGLVKDSLKLFGVGRLTCGQNNVRPTEIAWNGSSGGTMVDVAWTLGLRVEDISFRGDYGNDSVNVAGKGFAFSSTAGRITDEVTMNRVEVQRCTIGMECANTVCNGDMTMIDVSFVKCGTGFKTLGVQNLCYAFIRPEAVECDTGLHFTQGGFVAIEAFSLGSVGTCIKIENGGANSGNYVINGMRCECYRWNGYRPVMIDVEGWASTVKLCNLDTGVTDIESDKNTPLFKLATSSFLKVESSKVYGYKLATLAGTASGGQSFLEFDNCRFGSYSDPRVEGFVTHDAYSGFEVRNCEVGGGIISHSHQHAMQVTPMPPTGLTATRYSSTQINLAWTDNSTEDYFVIWRKVGSGGNWAQLTQVGSNVTTYQDTGLTTGATYYYRVYAKKIVRSIDSNEANATP